MKSIYIALLPAILISQAGCDKQEEWLDEKPKKSDVVPSTLENFKALLENTSLMNKNYPNIGITSADNFYLTYTYWQTISNAEDRNAYIWAVDIFEGQPTWNWSKPYERIAVANVALDGISKIERTDLNRLAWDNVKGSALFFRAMNFHELVQLFAKPYNASTANVDLGIPLRLTNNPGAPSVRASVAQTYRQIIDDLKEAVNLLPDTAQYRSQPSKCAAHALLARVYLNTGDYSQAIDHATNALSIYGSLIDFNDLNPNSNRPFNTFENINKEVIFYAQATSGVHLRSPNLIVDSNLFKSYVAEDLRRTVFYNNIPSFEGHYTGLPTTFFSGISTNELYLIRAEANARLNNKNAALVDLNTLLEKRWKAGFFFSFDAPDAAAALQIILTERRKELAFVGSLRWQDLRRLNLDPAFAVTISRELNEQTYTLHPNDNRYVLPIPPDEIVLSGIAQNPR